VDGAGADGVAGAVFRDTASPLLIPWSVIFFILLSILPRVFGNSNDQIWSD